MSYLKAHIFVSFHCFVQGFLPRKYSVVSSLALDYITLLYIVNELPLCSQWLFVTICLAADLAGGFRGWKPLTIITKHSILDVSAALDPSLL